MEGRELLEKLDIAYDYNKKKLDEIKKAIFNNPSSHNISKFYDDLLFYEYIYKKLNRYHNMYKTIEYNELVKYMIEDVEELIRDLVNCPWVPCSTNSLSNHNSIIEANAKADLVKLFSNILYNSGYKKMAFGLLFI